jgi:hypothetical protein
MCAVVQTQEEVFLDVEPLALAVVDGQHACIMACTSHHIQT